VQVEFCFNCHSDSNVIQTTVYVIFRGKFMIRCCFLVGAQLINYLSRCHRCFCLSSVRFSVTAVVCVELLKQRPRPCDIKHVILLRHNYCCRTTTDGRRPHIASRKYDLYYIYTRSAAAVLAKCVISTYN